MGMRSILKISLGAAILGASLMANAGGEGWLTDWNEAVKQSKKTGKPILADFTGSDWCGWCIKLNKEVFSTKEFKTWAAKNVILLEVDFPNSKPQSDKLKKQNDMLQKKFNIEGFPTIVFMNASGKEIGRSGYKEGGPKAWTSDAAKIIKK
ncbi:MAG: Thiol:disulfide interchange protein DsbD [Fimbriimonadaceae bacterium]|nr:Thiol:disulfide interchange protein DsbD [Fimbriimonadaceae bacterium]